MRSVRTSHVCNFSWSAPAGWNRFLFHRRFVNCLLKHCEIWKQGQFKHLKAAPISLTIVYAPIASCLFSISRSIQPFSHNSRLFQKISEDNRRFPNTVEESCLQTTEDVQRRNLGEIRNPSLYSHVKENVFTLWQIRIFSVTEIFVIHSN